MRARLLRVWCAISMLGLMAAAHAAVFTVDETGVDLGDLNPGDGKCEYATFVPADQRCTLRAAIQEANAESGADSILVPAGAEIDLDKGALEIGGPLTIGIPLSGDPHTVIKSDGSGRVFDIDADIGDVNFMGLDIADGTAPSSDSVGGGILERSGDHLSLIDCALYGNAAHSGAAIFSYDNLSLLRVEIHANVATANGAAMVIYDSSATPQATLSISDSSIHNNLTFNSSGDIEGSALQLGPLQSVEIDNTTISANLPDGVSLENTPAVLRNDTITASSYTGLTYFVDSSGFPELKLYDSIIAGNGTDCDFSGSYSTDAEYNLYGDDSCPGGFSPNLFNTDPRLAPLAPRGNGLPLHELMPGSPAIDAGDPRDRSSQYYTCTDYDQDGRVRGWNANLFPETTGLRCDIGAAEFNDLIFRDGFE